MTNLQCLEECNNQLAIAVRSLLALQRDGHTGPSLTSASTEAQYAADPMLAVNEDPVEAHRLRQSMLAHLSQLQTLLFLDEPSGFLRSLTKKVTKPFPNTARKYTLIGSNILRATDPVISLPWLAC